MHPKVVRALGRSTYTEEEVSERQDGEQSEAMVNIQKVLASAYRFPHPSLERPAPNLPSIVHSQQVVRTTLDSGAKRKIRPRFEKILEAARYEPPLQAAQRVSVKPLPPLSVQRPTPLRSRVLLKCWLLSEDRHEQNVGWSSEEKRAVQSAAADVAMYSLIWRY